MFTMGPPMWGGAGTSVAPLDITAFFGTDGGFWVDFTDPATAFSDLGGTTLATLGSTILSVRTKGPGTPLAPIVPPAWDWTADSSGAPSADKDGTEDHMYGLALPMLSGGYTQVSLFDYAGVGISAVADSDLSGARSFQGLTLNGTSASWQTFEPSNVVGDAFGISAPVSTKQVVSFRVSPTVWSGRLNRATAGGASLSRSLPSGYDAAMLIGAASLSSGGTILRKFNGRLYCIMMINRYLSDAEVLSVENEMLRAAGMI